MSRGLLRPRNGSALQLGPMGFGAAPLGNMHHPLTEEEAVAVVEEAWRLGLRYFDTAPLYGHGLSEQRVGAALRGRDRAAFVISTKVGRRLEPCDAGNERAGIYVDTPPVKVAFDYSYDGVMAS